jgi:hypothetical protein
MLKQIPLLTLIVVALTAVTCYGFHRLTPSAPCDVKQITLITGFWLLVAAAITGICRFFWKRKTTPGH